MAVDCAVKHVDSNWFGKNITRFEGFNLVIKAEDTHPKHELFLG